MPINSCTLAVSTIDALCTDRRRVTVSSLLRKKYPPASVTGSGNVVLRDSFAQNYARPWWNTDDSQPQLDFEQPFITVTAELLGTTGVQQIETSSRLDFVLVPPSSLEIRRRINVNVFDFKIEPLGVDAVVSDVIVNISNFGVTPRGTENSAHLIAVNIFDLMVITKPLRLSQPGTPKLAVQVPASEISVFVSDFTIVENVFNVEVSVFDFDVQVKCH